MTFPPSEKQYLDPKTFKCVKCGECCRPIVKVSEEEIQRIEQTGLSRTLFLQQNPIDEKEGKNTLKQINGVCMFLQRQGEEFICSMYNARPDICRKYPFITQNKISDCRPKNWEKWMDLKKLFPDSSKDQANE